MSEKKYLGSMIDCSRNAVMTVKSVKQYIDLIAKMGYNMLMLYTEDTYEIEGYPYFGYLRGRYSKEELKEIVAYGEEKGIELIPCIQTLGHLNTIFRWKAHSHLRDTGGVLLAEEEETYKFIDSMLKTVKECFKSKKIHIGMDEAYDIGMGKYLQKHGFTDKFEILKKHLAKVTEMVKEQDLEPPMWSDMFFAIVNNDNYYAYSNPDIITPEIAALVPENVELVYWDYFTFGKSLSDNMIKAHKHFNNPLWFAGGVQSWGDFTAHNSYAIHCTKNALDSCIEQGVENIIMTCWGDDGNEVSKYQSIPVLFYAAQRFYGIDDYEVIKENFKQMFNISFEDFLKLQYPNRLKEFNGRNDGFGDRCFFYNDPFFGIYDNLVTDELEESTKKYANYKEELLSLKNYGEYGYLFGGAAALCDFLSVKVCLGKHTRKAYKANDKNALENVVNEYDLCIEKLNAYYETLRYQWYKENKRNGFEIQDIRLGGLLKRLEDCKRVLLEYINGEIEAIPELDEEILDGANDWYDNKWGKIVSVNHITQWHF